MTGVNTSLLERLGHFLHRFLSEVTASVIVTASIAGATTAYLHYSNNAPAPTVQQAAPVMASAPAAPSAPVRPATDLTGMLSPVVADPMQSQLQPATAGKPLMQPQPPVTKPASASSSQWRKKVIAVLAKTRKPDTTGSTEPLTSPAPAAPLTPPDRTLADAAPPPPAQTPAPAPQPVAAGDDLPLLPPGLIPQGTTADP